MVRNNNSCRQKCDALLKSLCAWVIPNNDAVCDKWDKNHGRAAKNYFFRQLVKPGAASNIANEYCCRSCTSKQCLKGKLNVVALIFWQTLNSQMAWRKSTLSHLDNVKESHESWKPWWHPKGTSRVFLKETLFFINWLNILLFVDSCIYIWTVEITHI